MAIRPHRNNKPDYMRRSVSLGIAELSAPGMAPFRDLRASLIDHANCMVDLAFEVNPLNPNAQSKSEIDKVLRKYQRDAFGVNKAYLESARERVADSLAEQTRRFFKGLARRLHNCDEEKYRPLRKTRLGLVPVMRRGDDGRRWSFLPKPAEDEARRQALAREIRKEESRVKSEGGADAGPRTDAEIEAEATAEFSADLEATFDKLKKIAENRQTSKLFRKTDDFKLSPLQRAIVEEIRRETLERHRKPIFAAALTDKGSRAVDDHTIQIALDYRVVCGKRKTSFVPHLDQAMRQALASGQIVRASLPISNPVPRGAPIELPTTFHPKFLSRLNEDLRAHLSAVVIEIGPKRLEVRGILAKEKAEIVIPDSGPIYVVGRDYGYANTVAYRVFEIPAGCSWGDLVERAETMVASFDKPKARAYLEGGVLPEGARVVAEKIWSGRNWQGAIKGHTDRIDKLSSQIDGIYGKIARLKDLLVRSLQPRPSADGQVLVPEDIDTTNKEGLSRNIVRAHEKFFVLLDHAHHLKGIRKSVFQTIHGLKKSWLGFLGNRECELAMEHGAAVVREHLTVMAVEKGTPEYRGRRFNRMINDGSKGQYIRRTSDKLAWAGIPELAIPSYWTSSACIDHGLVDKAIRKTERFLCPKCAEMGRPVDHADLNAAGVIASYLFLQRVPQEST